MAKKRRPKQIRQELSRNMHVDSEGRAKKAYRTEREARDSAHLSWILNNVELNSYRCGVCHQWHNGRPFRNP